MSTVLFILMVVVLSFVLNVIIIQSYNFLFIIINKPWVWILFMALLGVSYFYMGSQFANSFNVVWWSAFLAFLLQIPPSLNKRSGITKQERSTMVDEVYSSMGIENGRLKYRIGLASYLLGAAVGWVVFYGEMVTITG